MRIKVIDPVLDYESKPLVNGTEPVPWRKVFSEALNTMLPNEVQTAEDKNKCYQITMKVFASNEVDLTLDDRHFLLGKIQKIFNPLVCGRAAELLEGEEPAGQVN